jgi:hypothetical protein
MGGVSVFGFDVDLRAGRGGGTGWACAACAFPTGRAIGSVFEGSGAAAFPLVRRGFFALAAVAPLVTRFAVAPARPTVVRRFRGRAASPLAPLGVSAFLGGTVSEASGAVESGIGIIGSVAPPSIPAGLDGGTVGGTTAVETGVIDDGVGASPAGTRRVPSRAQNFSSPS